MEYAVVDIETTGGNAASGGITEIAIFIFDGQHIVDQYETLINPLRPIPYSIQILTGISNEMVAGAPTFEEVAEEVFHYLHGRIFVAHNVNFDFSFIHYYLKNYGYELKVPKLCTVRLSRKIRPGLPSYSLGKLCDSLSIQLHDRHRAGGDAEATTILLSKLIDWDTDGIIDKMLSKGTKEQILPPNLDKKEFDTLPESPGVYYLLDNQLKPIYIGKAVNIKKRVGQHFTGNNQGPQRQNFLREVCHISFEICATELMALLLEAIEIKKRWPKYNRALKNYEPKFGMYNYLDMDGYQRLVVGRIGRMQHALQTFSSEEDGRYFLRKIVKDFQLCPARCMLGKCSFEDNCYACGSLPEMPETYNERVNDALSHIAEYLPSYYLLDKGRHPDEYSVIWIEKGEFYAMGYVSKNSDLTMLSDIKNSLTRYANNPYIASLIYNFAIENRDKVHWIRQEDQLQCI